MSSFNDERLLNEFDRRISPASLTEVPDKHKHWSELRLIRPYIDSSLSQVANVFFRLHKIGLSSFDFRMAISPVPVNDFHFALAILILNSVKESQQSDQK